MFKISTNIFKKSFNLSRKSSVFKTDKENSSGRSECHTEDNNE